MCAPRVDKDLKHLPADNKDSSSGWADAQAHLSLHCMHIPSCLFCCGQLKWWVHETGIFLSPEQPTTRVQPVLAKYHY